MFFDTAIPYQINLQDSATYGMEMIIQLHNYVMFLNVFIISVVIWFFFEIIAVTGFVQWFFYRVKLRTKKTRLSHLIYLQINKAMLHMSTLEVIWTLLPVLALISIALPSLSMLYYFSLSFSPAIVINVIGHQWFWSYEYQPYNDELLTIFPFVSSSKELFNSDLNLSQFSDITDVDTNVFMNAYNDSSELTFKGMLNTVANRPYISSINNVEVNLIQSAANEEFSKYAFDSIMLQVEDLNYGSFRLLEVDKPLYLPVDTPIRVIVSSDDVLHSWAVPSLGVKIDCVPGRLNVVEFRIARTGVFYGQCSEICGTQHGFMPICIVSVPRKLFNFI